MVKNETGSSLLAVLLIMSVFTITGLGLIGLTVNNTKQVSKIGNDLQATNLAEMGTSHIKETIFQLLSENTEIDEIDFKKDLENNLKDPFMLDTGSYYQIEIDHVSSDHVNNVETVTVEFTSNGFANNKPKSISGTIEATKTPAESFPPPIPDNVVWESGNKITYNSNLKEGETFNSPIYYVNGFENKIHEKPLVYLDGLYSKEIDLENKSIVSVIGDTYVLEVDPKKGSGKSLLCVEGTLHIYGSPPDTAPQIDSNRVCPKRVDSDGSSLKPGTLKINSYGIYARNVKYHNEPAKWDKNNIVIDAQYE